MYSRLYQLTHDMDCYFNLNGYPIHIATNGGIIPDSIGTIEELQGMQNEVAHIDATREYWLNRDYLSRLNVNSFPSQEEWEESEVQMLDKFGIFEGNDNDLPFHWKLYSQSFVENARKGFYSFDRISTSWAGFDIYMLIAWPKNLYPFQSMSVGHHFILYNYDEFYCGNIKFWPLAQMLDEAEIWD